MEQGFINQPLVQILTAVILGAVGQILLKDGVKTVFPEGVSISLAVFNAFLNLKVLLGFMLYGVSSLLWLMVLSKRDLSYAYPMIAAGYVVVVFLSWLVFKEHVPTLRIAGLVLICLGVAIVGVSAAPNP